MTTCYKEMRSGKCKVQRASRHATRIANFLTVKSRIRTGKNTSAGSHSYNFRTVQMSTCNG